MSIEELQGREYRQRFRVDRSNVGLFIEATGDDANRWRDAAPPSFAAAALFAVAPAFLYDPAVGDFSRVLIHADQTFRWFAPWEIDTDYAVAGSVDRVRLRGGSAWVAFTATVSTTAATVLESVSTFIMSDQRPESSVAEGAEPGPNERADETRPVSFPSEGALPETVRSASRSDLIRYAAASRDFNPLHWDRATARNAGLPGAVVHGLLMASWMLQTVVAVADPTSPLPVRDAKFRFRNPLLPGRAASITGTIAPEGPIELQLGAESGPLMSGTFTADR